MNSYDHKYNHSNDKISLLQDTPMHQEQQNGQRRKPREPSLFMALVRSFGEDFTVTGVLKFFQDLLNFVSPLLLKYVQHYAYVYVLPQHGSILLSSFVCNRKSLADCSHFCQFIELVATVSKRFFHCGSLILQSFSMQSSYNWFFTDSWKSSPLKDPRYNCLCRLIIQFIEDESQPDWHGYVFAILLFTTALVQSLILNQYFYRAYIIGMRIRTAVIAAVYNKVTLILRYIGISEVSSFQG